MQVRANLSNNGADVGNSASSVGSFSTLLLDVNSTYENNDPTGYPRAWKKYTVTLQNLPTAGVPNARFAFRYMGTDAGIFGGSGGENYPSIVGIDSLAFVHN